MEIYKDKHQSVATRVEDLLAKMTLEEKAAQLCGDLPFPIIDKGKVSFRLSALNSQPQNIVLSCDSS